MTHDALFGLVKLKKLHTWALPFVIITVFGSFGTLVLLCVQYMSLLLPHNFSTGPAVHSKASLTYKGYLFTIGFADGYGKKKGLKKYCTASVLIFSTT